MTRTTSENREKRTMQKLEKHIWDRRSSHCVEKRDVPCTEFHMANRPCHQPLSHDALHDISGDSYLQADPEVVPSAGGRLVLR